MRSASLFLQLFLLSLLTLGRTVQCETANRYLIGFERGITTSALGSHPTAALTARLGVQGATVIESGMMIAATLTPAEVNAIKANGDVAFVEPVISFHALVDPNDDLYVRNRQWALGPTPGINASQAWELSKGSASSVIAVIDTGIDYRHPDLGSKIFQNPGEIPGNNIDDDENGYVDDVNGYDFAGNDGDPLDHEGHGTHVSGTIAAVTNNALGIAGIAWNSTILPLKSLDDTGYGSDETIIQAIYYAINLKKRGIPILLMNMSLGGARTSSGLRQACADAGDAGIIIVAAAGNETLNNDYNGSYPANYSRDMRHVVSVAAVNANGRLSYFSNYGGGTVDLAAPGEDVVSTFLTEPADESPYARASGTSMAAPHVSGVLALMAAYRTMAPETMVEILRSSAKPLPDLAGQTKSGGTLDAFGALSALRDYRLPYVLSGAVTLAEDPAPPRAFSGVTISIPELGLVTTSNAFGSFTFDGVLERTTLSVVPALAGYQFNPPSQVVTISGDTQVSFSGKLQKWQVLGAVTVGKKKISGSKITLLSLASAARQTMKSRKGLFTFANVTPGRYVLSINDKRYKFKPASATIQVGNADSTKNFKGKLLVSSARR